MKKYAVFLYALFVLHSENEAQSISDKFIVNYRHNYHQYFDSVHNISKANIKHFENSYYAYVVFDLDLIGVVNNLRIVEVPGASVPYDVKKHIISLFISTNRNWSFNKNDCSLVEPIEMIFLITLSKFDQPREERLKEDETIINYFLGNGLHVRNRELDKLAASKDKKVVALLY